MAGIHAAHETFETQGVAAAGDDQLSKVSTIHHADGAGHRLLRRTIQPEDNLRNTPVVMAKVCRQPTVHKEEVHESRNKRSGHRGTSGPQPKKEWRASVGTTRGLRRSA